MAIIETQHFAPFEQSEQEILIKLTADFGPDGSFGSRNLVVTRDAVQVLEPSAGVPDADC